MDEKGSEGGAGEKKRKDRPGGKGSRPLARQRGYDERIRPAHVIQDTIASPILISCEICGEYDSCTLRPVIQVSSLAIGFTSSR